VSHKKKEEKMRVLVVYAHPQRWSLNHAILKSFTKGLVDGGHTFEVVDLYAIKFDPIVRSIDLASCVSEDLPEWVLEVLNLRESFVQGAGGPIKKFLAKTWSRNKSLKEIAKVISQAPKPKAVLEQQEKVARADAIAFVSPVWWNSFPTILKGWVERVFSYGFAYSLSEAGWRGDVEGRIPLLKLKKALIINTLFFKEEAYKEAGLLEAMRVTLDEWSLKYPGVTQVDHVYFPGVYGVDNATREGWVEHAYGLGKDF
jgi:NAD(P)H dehydrogenase (quinone)